MSKANLDQLYSLRRNFSIIGITGRVGSGCSEVAKILEQDFSFLPEIGSSCGEKTIQSQKREIVHDFCAENWKKYKVIEYKKVLLFLLLPDLLNKPQNNLLYDYFRFYLKDQPDIKKIKKIKIAIQKAILEERDLVEQIKKFKITSPKFNKSEKNLKKIGDIFWGSNFNELADKVDSKLFLSGFIERKMLLHHIANNYRASGSPFGGKKNDSKNIFHIALAINKIIKATKAVNTSCHIAIDSLKNSLEINFFRERYSAFYMVAVKNDNRHNEIPNKYKTKNTEELKRLVEMDDGEYSCSDYSKGMFYVPDVQNCIQISDYHISVRKTEASKLNSHNRIQETFYSLKEQVYRLQALIQQPGLITPEPIERVMQLAFTARLNSGCISRQVGAAVTDKNFSVKAIGWNDVPKGATPCSLRNAKEINSCGFGFTKFEKGEGIKEMENISDEVENKAPDEESVEFNDYVSSFYNDSNFPDTELKGKNCPYCFKSAYNSFKGDKNQVHTRSLHAEENAMLQISKFGGQALEGGYLFTTASTCELCAKKAYQLGINTIYYIDPYPGISRNHILKSNQKTDPEMVLFSGAVGRAYLKFFEPFMAQKDELALIAGKTLEEPEKITKLKVKDLLKGVKGLDKVTRDKLDDIFKKEDINTNEKLLEIIKKGLKE